MRFSYIKMRGKYLPIIPLKVKGEDGWTIYDAFVGSGAGYSIFQSDMYINWRFNSQMRNLRQ